MTATTGASAKDKLTFADNGPTLTLFGHNDSNLKLIERELGVELHSKGGELTVVGDPASVAITRSLLEQLYEMVKRGRALHAVDVARAAATLRAEPSADLNDIFADTLLIAGRSRAITPKGLAQKRYVDAIRRFDIVFGIGPAGTGKTYLAMAMAVRALLDKRVKRIVLTRPAVEAGEKLGFLPGNMAEKVNPYLRPLYDALHDMMDFDKAARLVEHGTIEVAPLAFMRGRAQPVTTPVLTHEGWREIGSLAPGDWVIGSGGKSTQVLGVYPQGAKEIYRVTATDGASTLCCGEHLWSVSTSEDPSERVVETREMIGKLDSRFELPMLSAPVNFAPREIPHDPYALGLLLGKTSSSAASPAALAAGGEATAAVSQTPQLSLNERFVPDDYLFNTPEVRLAVLQGLLAAGGEVDDDGLIRYSTTSPRLREDVAFLARSLGGTATVSANIIDVRLPLGKGGRPTRHVTSIEAAGVAECVCIRVAAVDSLYVTEDFLLTHNTLNDSFVILDEAQNTTSEQMKMFLTRQGYESKCVITGDVTQVDLPNGQRSGLAEARDLLTGIEGIQFCAFTDLDVVRHPLVQQVIRAYEKRDLEKAAKAKLHEAPPK